MAGHIGQDVHPFFKAKQNVLLDPQPTLDSEEPLRKRQRTHSPDEQPAIVSKWEQDHTGGILVGSVSKDSYGSEDPIEVPEQVDGGKCNDALIQTESAVEIPALDDQNSKTTKDDRASVRSTPPKKMLKVRSNGKLASPKAPIEPLEAQIMGLPQDLAPSKRRTSKMPNRNLKISANGTLDSPSEQASSDVTKHKGRKKKVDSGASVKPKCVVALKYQVVDGVEVGTGRQIDEILSGKSRIPRPKSEVAREPPKSTHPFFTGELARKPAVEPPPAGGIQSRTVDSKGSLSQQAMPSKTHFGPRESRITSKPAGAGQQLDDTYGKSLPTFGTDHAKIARFPGAIEPSWPPFEMVRVGDIPATDENRTNASNTNQMLERSRKLKETQIHILPEENILNKMTQSVNFYDDQEVGIQRMPTSGARSFRRPNRRLMTGAQLQKAIRSRVSSSLSNALASRDPMEDELSSSQKPICSPHKSLLDLAQRLPKSCSAFDKFQCEREEWTHKYSPKCAEHVLQLGRDAEILRDWLKELTVSSVGGGADEGRTRDSSLMSKRGDVKSSRRKKRKTEDLDDFVVPSDEEPEGMTEIAGAQNAGFYSSQDKKSVMRAGVPRDGERNANTVIISGPHGCGKTAAVFAVAKELDFEIFEVNAGSRRSGKDVLDKVGEMTRNHLVQHRPDSETTGLVDPSSDLLQVDEQLQADLNSGRQGTMQSFFKVQGAAKKHVPNVKEKSLKLDSKKGASKKKVLQDVLSKPRDQKQSLILLEEVDILFEEDKLFWATVLDLLSRSKRPVIMTCSDENFVPLDDMALHAILRFAAPPADLATDYLLLVAASEGHLLSRDSVQLLYEVKGSDLRGSLAELNFYCQMGIGDSKGGLEWMLLDKTEHALENAELPRVISEGTYAVGMGWLSGEDASSQQYRTLGELSELSAEIWDGWHLDVADTTLLEPLRVPQISGNSSEETLRYLRVLDRFYGAFSAADILPATAVRRESSTKLNTCQPDLNEQSRCSYVEGPGLLQADSQIDHSGTSNDIAFALRASAAMTIRNPARCSISVQQVNEIIALAQTSSRPPEITLLNMMSTFQPIADDSSSTYAISKYISSSCFDGPLSIVLQDVAPYIRGIVSYDLRLEEQRRQLNNLLAESGPKNKKTRTTRASRAALEGGDKASTRRERWFPTETNFDSVINTGGREWQKVATQVSLEHSKNQRMDSSGSGKSSEAGTDT